ncbi:MULTISPECIES: flagellar hook-associated protein FlgL [unclassified Arsenophonus]|uniref:flagellar hook-associated protein FlgL n=1 Tax=unclassified Arsenophonus TaxID=2627083 RepID=UPI00285F97B4|nr:flagellar hook-associated protein FlgL [Arsenophonus sp.]MDR5610751.1 flagellar hook-associated protein FlgL [Arsenophonus sp.]MDR5614510.1 flagellar hook-associated protein FlgL [Arsenophonus sp.]
MITRLSNQLMHYQKMSSMMRSQSDLAEKYQRITTKERLLQAADDPAAAAESLQIKQTQVRLAQYQRVNNIAQHQMQSQLQVVDKMADVTRNIKETLVAVSNQSILNDKEHLAYATKIEDLKSQLFVLANSKDGSGNYMFAGYKTDTAPLEMNNSGTVSYQGGADVVKQHIDADREVTVYFTAEQVLLPTAGSNIFQSLDSVITTLKTPYQSAAPQDQTAMSAVISTATRGLQDTTKALSTITSQLGLQLKEVENLNSRHEETSVLLKERQSQLMDTNLLEEITEFKQLEEVMQASYSIYGQMKDLSLFKILR